MELASGKDQDRRCALRYLYELRDARAIPFLRAIAEDSSKSKMERGMAVDQLGVLNDTDSFDFIVGLLQPDPNDRLTWDAIRALGFLQDDRAGAKLRSLAETSAFTYARGVIVDAIGAHRDASAQGVLGRIADAAAVKGDDSMLVYVVKALVRIRTPESLTTAEGLLPKIHDSRSKSDAISDADFLLQVALNGATDPKDRAELQATLARVRIWRP